MMALITGASGFIIGQWLLAPGERPPVRRPARRENEAVGDLLDPKSLSRACPGGGTVFRCAGLVDDLAGNHDSGN